MKELVLQVSKEDEGERIDLYLASRSALSRSRIQELIGSGAATVNGAAVKPSYRVRAGDRVEVAAVAGPEREPVSLVAEPLQVEVVYRDEDLIVVNKPAGMVMYPAAGHARGTLMNAIAWLAGPLDAPGAPLRPGVVHRIDRDTSGLVVVALSDRAYYGLVGQFKERTVERSYTAIVHGLLREDEGVVELKIGRSPLNRKKMSTKTRRGKPARTSWRVLERYGLATMIEARLATGRTHQIRVHFSALGHPVLGDRDYGRKTSVRLDGRVLKIPRQMLHAERLGFIHPVTGGRLAFRAPLPEDMIEVVQALRAASG